MPVEKVEEVWIYAYVTKEVAMRPTKPTVAPPTAVILQPKISVKTLTMGEQKKIIPMEREPTSAAGDTSKLQEIGQERKTSISLRYKNR